jgi:hypothetical protein
MLRFHHPAGLVSTTLGSDQAFIMEFRRTTLRHLIGSIMLRSHLQVILQQRELEESLTRILDSIISTHITTALVQSPQA